MCVIIIESETYHFRVEKFSLTCQKLFVDNNCLRNSGQIGQKELILFKKL